MKPVPPDQFLRLPPAHAVDCVAGLSPAIDAVAARAATSHRFLRYGWFAAALAAYRGAARTLIVAREGRPVLALPMVRRGPACLRLAEVPGCYWPFRSFPVAEDAGLGAVEAMLPKLAREVTALRLGPVQDGDPGLALLRYAASAAGWTVIDRFVATTYLLDIDAARAQGPWPRTSTLKKNRFHEKHLAAHGALDWSIVSGGDWSAAMFDDLAAIERRSWITDRTDGRDAKFAAARHGAFWRAAAQDPVIAAMMCAAVLRIDGRPTAFSFDLNIGSLKYAIANSFDPAFARHSPGKLLYTRNLVRAVDDGVARVDWGGGDSGYKGVIGAVEGPAIRDWLFVRPGAPALAAGMLRGLWRRSGNPVEGD